MSSEQHVENSAAAQAPAPVDPEQDVDDMLFEEIQPSIMAHFGEKKLSRDHFLLRYLRPGLIAGRENCGSNFARCPIDENLETRRACVLLDVRSPCEFANGHIPGATNVPMFTDEERKRVGFTFTKVGKKEAVNLGMKYVQPKLAVGAEAPADAMSTLALAAVDRELGRSAGELQDLHSSTESQVRWGGVHCADWGGVLASSQSKASSSSDSKMIDIDERLRRENVTVIVMCFRGGMRSKSVAWHLAAQCDGLFPDVRILEGGYKGYRRWVLDLWEPGKRTWNQDFAPKAEFRVAQSHAEIEELGRQERRLRYLEGEAGQYHPEDDLSAFKVCVITGRTGVGKTKVLESIPGQVIDLEAMAMHKGSTFGAVPFQLNATPANQVVEENAAEVEENAGPAESDPDTEATRVPGDPVTASIQEAAASGALSTSTSTAGDEDSSMAMMPGGEAEDSAAEGQAVVSKKQAKKDAKKARKRELKLKNKTFAEIEEMK